jgi:hypothetical protein
MHQRSTVRHLGKGCTLGFPNACRERGFQVRTRVAGTCLVDLSERLSDYRVILDQLEPDETSCAATPPSAT